MQRRQFITASAALATTAGLANAAQQDDVSRLGRTAHTKFAVNVEMWWGRLPFLRRLEEAARLGFPAVEFWPWEGKDIRAIADTCHQTNPRPCTADDFRRIFAAAM